MTPNPQDGEIGRRSALPVSVSGEWRFPAGSWARPASVVCRLCGRPLFGRVWRSVVNGVPCDFCDPGCEALLHDYWLPRHGPATAPEP